MSKIKPKSKVNKILNVILTLILIIILIVLLVNSVLAIVKPDYMPNIFGYQFYTVVTDSMVPTISVGSLVITKKVNAKTEFKKGDIITFNVTNSNGQKIIVTHYFREIKEHSDGKIQYVTYAEAQKDTEQTDGWFVERDDIRGMYVVHIPWVGKLAMFLKSKPALFMYVFLAIVFIAGGYFIKKAKKEIPKS